MTPLHDSGFEYLVFDPADGRRAEKLVVLLHGYGRNAHYMEKMASAARETAPAARILCIHGPERMTGSEIADGGADHYLHMPQEMQAEMQGGAEGFENDPDPESAFALRPAMRRQWFAIDGRAADLFPRIRRVAERMNSFIDMQRDALALTDADIALMGFSQGAGLALYTALTRKTELGGLICHSSIIIHNPETNGAPDADMLSRPPILYIYGEADPEFPQKRFRDTFEWLQNYTENRAVEKTVPGLGHYTNSKSRQICAGFIRDIFS